MLNVSFSGKQDMVNVSLNLSLMAELSPKLINVPKLETG